MLGFSLPWLVSEGNRIHITCLNLCFRIFWRSVTFALFLICKSIFQSEKCMHFLGGGAIVVMMYDVVYG